MLRSPTTPWKVEELSGRVISRRAPDDVNFPTTIELRPSLFA
jgi:hypothetical protein